MGVDKKNTTHDFLFLLEKKVVCLETSFKIKLILLIIVSLELFTMLSNCTHSVLNAHSLPSTMFFKHLAYPYLTTIIISNYILG